MNVNLPERFLHGFRPERDEPSTQQMKGTPITLNTDIRIYVSDAEKAQQTSSATWLRHPEIPATEEVWRNDDEDVELPVNKIRGPWRNKDRYLKAHFELLREDAVGPLREAVDDFRQNPQMVEEDRGKVAIYEKARIVIIGAQIGLTSAGPHKRIRVRSFRGGSQSHFLYLENWQGVNMGPFQTLDVGFHRCSHSCNRQVPYQMYLGNCCSSPTCWSAGFTTGSGYLLCPLCRAGGRPATGMDNDPGEARLLRSFQTHYESITETQPREVSMINASSYHTDTVQQFPSCP